MSELTLELPTEPLTVDEVRRRVPTLRRIEDENMRDEVQQLTRYAPEYFWIRPGSYDEYHNATRYGLWHHTLKLSTVIDRLFVSFQKQRSLDDSDRDIAHAAAILHDQWKNGEKPESAQTSEYHPRVMGDIIEEYTDLPTEVSCAVRAHMGPWGDYPPATAIDDLVHMADMIASDDDISISVYGPLPHELHDIVDGVIALP